MSLPHPILESPWSSIWPGLPKLWFNGSWRGLFTALIFSNLLVLAILTVVVWPELLRMGAKAVVCFSVIVIWLTIVVPQIRSQLSHPKELREGGEAKHLFHFAQTEYLKRNWFQAEELLNQLLAVDSDDQDARLLKATLLRRRGQRAEAQRELDFVEQFSAERKWAWEIKEERRLLTLPVEESSSTDVKVA